MSDELAAWLLVQVDEDERRARATNAPHIATWNPDRALAECAAKRSAAGTFLQAHEVLKQDSSDIAAFECTRVLGPLLRLMAVVYAERPGYRDEWRPDTA